jgi:DNA uptake protein ComE-like DNA-binding protein
MKRSKYYSLALLLALFVSPIPLIAQTSGTASAPAKSSSGSKSSSSGSKLDINTATADQLKALPGIDAATAQKIIAGRPYHGKNDLVSKNIITKTEYDTIKEQIIAHHVQGASSGAAAKGTPAKQ